MLRRVDKNTVVMFGAVVSTAIQKVGKCREGVDSWEHRGEREPRSQARERRWRLSPERGARGASSQEGKRPPAASPGGAPLSSSLRRLGQFLSFLGSRSAGRGAASYLRRQLPGLGHPLASRLRGRSRGCLFPPRCLERVLLAAQGPSFGEPDPSPNEVSGPHGTWGRTVL